ncbi:MAG TPA: protoporphyrinogen oxidase [Verrucomicrobiae bacterium]|nr:protoporphyrinogen oxidase [Verrucomicrobiae bacterium]
MSGPRRIAIVGAGIAGLSTAYHLEKLSRERGEGLDCRLLESAAVVGGVIRSERVGGFLLDTGADSLFKGKPAAIDLSRELGLGDEILEASRQELPTLIYSRGRLRPLPAGLEMLSPTRVLPFLMSGLISLPGKLRMFAEPFVASGAADADESVAAFMTRRFGAEASEKIAGPLFAGIHAGDPERLSILSTFPRLVELERRHGSLAAALRKGPKAPGGPPPSAPGRPGPPFVSFRGGIRRIVEALESSLRSTRIERGATVARLERTAGGYRVHIAGREPVDVDACVVAVPAPQGAGLLDSMSPGVASELRKIRYASSATVFLGYRAVDTGSLPGSTGFLIPFTERRRIFGCTFVSNKFLGRAPDGSVLLRAFVGGAVDESRAETGDAEMVAMVREELAFLIGLRAEPTLVHIARWPKANPQYDVGHRGIVAAVDAELRDLPGLIVTGSGLRGVGIPDGVASGRAAAARILGEPLPRGGASLDRATRGP